MGAVLSSLLQREHKSLHFAFAEANDSEGNREGPLYTGVQAPEKLSTSPSF